MASLKTYEAPSGDLPEDERVYLKQFGQETTRYIMSELKFINNLEEEWLCELFFKYYDDTGILVGVADSLGFEKPGIIQSMYIFKPPHIGGEVVCHQDSTYIYTEPESCVGFWFALQDATLENGCMRFIPGAHKAPLRKRNYRDESGRIVNEILDDTPFDLADAVPAEAPAGTLVVFDGRAPHYSGPNLSDRSRHAYTLHVIDQACHYPASNWLQRSADLPLRGFEHQPA